MSVADIAPAEGRAAHRDPFAVRARLQPLCAAGRRTRTAALASALALAALVGVGATAAVDYFVVLALAGRAVGLVLTVTLVAGLWLRLRQLARYDDHRAAEDAERRHPDYGQRLRTCLDYDSEAARPAPAAAPLVDALRRDTRERTANVDLVRVVDRRPLWSIAAACGLVLFAGLIVLVAVPDSRIALARALLLLRYYTTVAVSPVETPVMHGDDVPVAIEVRGRPLAAADVYFRHADGSGDWERLPFELREASGTSDESGDGAAANDRPAQRLEATIGNCRRDFDLVVVAGPLPHDVVRIVVRQPLVLEDLHVRVVPPAYLQREAYDAPPASIKAPEGSSVRLQFRFNRPPAEAELLIRTAGEKSDTATNNDRASSQPKLLEQFVECELADLRRSMRLRLTAAADGVDFESAEYRIAIQPDRPPQVRVQRPPEELEVTPTTEVRLAVDALDDNRLSRVGVAYQVGSGPLTTLWEQSPEGVAETVEADAVMYLEEHGLTFQDAVTYYAFAEDNYFGSPRRTTTELRFIDIRPFKRAYEIVDSPGGT